MKKESSVFDLLSGIDFSKYVKPAAILGGAVLVPVVAKAVTNIGQNVLRAGIAEAAQKERPADMSVLINSAKKFGNIGNLQHAIIKDYSNAAYIPSGSIPDRMYPALQSKANTLLSSKNPKEIAMGKFISKGLSFSRSQDGGIILGDRFRSPSIIAHELGHAIVDKNGGFDNFVQENSWIPRMLGATAGAAGLAGKVISGAEYNDYLLWGGLGAMGLGMLGKVYSEYIASEHGKDILRKSKLLDKNREKMLNLALGTYAVSGVKNMAQNAAYLGLSAL